MSQFHRQNTDAPISLDAFAGFLRRPSPVKPIPHRSVAVWPNTISVGNVEGKNESIDEHHSAECAQAVCELLEKHGFGGNGKVFPISTRVEPIAD